ncbi:hypothetical protein D9757_012362 [Collybiopsis confluens]|uniref:non-specific serine/threonine protein kinase n=1 Tax=Collybiopsis confluens TaxID=2823264 RepID=A0A8H5CN42_9AGAR|nr:hypothetical protein D9757_014028 [Collybiopsis confluens]KAF5357555.1 hypothetical protein D9757_012362 [Collybiopsis confluens]
MDQLSRTLETFKDQAKDALWALSGWGTSCFCSQGASVKINGRTFKIIKVLGEGGFSFVYLAQDEGSGRQFALKKIRCPTGNDGVKEAMREVEAYRRFKHPNIIRILDSAVVQDPDGEDGGGKIVYLFLPLYQRGNIQDRINSNVVNSSYFPELEIIKLFKGTCEAVRAMHEYRAKGGKGAKSKSGSSSNGSTGSRRNGPGSGSGATAAASSSNAPNDEDDEDDDARLPEPEGDAEGGYSYGPAPSARRSKPFRMGSSGSDAVPLMDMDRHEANGGGDAGEILFDGDEDVSGIGGEEGQGERGEIVPYAHRDIKPGNVMISDEGRPILMDFGSAMRARLKIENRSQALYQQDIAAEQSTMAYRAPELFDVKTGIDLDEKVDIWSLGCLLFAMLYSHSPFENTQTTEQGGSIAMAVLNAQYKHPQAVSGRYSAGLRELVDKMLRVDPKERPVIGEVVRLCGEVEGRLR